MVQKLIDVLTLRVDATAGDSASMTQALKGALVSLGMQLKSTYTNSLLKKKARRNMYAPSQTPAAPSPYAGGVHGVADVPASDVAGRRVLPATSSTVPRSRKRSRSNGATPRDSSSANSTGSVVGKPSSVDRQFTGRGDLSPPSRWASLQRSGQAGVSVDSVWSSSPFPEMDTYTTDFLGYRRLHLHEIVRLNVGDGLIVVIPADV